MISTPPQRGTLLLLAFALFGPTLSAYTTTNNSNLHDNNKDCNCYVLNSGADSNTPEYFQYYRFFDFRNLADRPNQYTTSPPLVNNTQKEGHEPVWAPSVLNSEAWNTDWGIQNWSKPADKDFPIPMTNSPANIYISQNPGTDDPFTWLTLRTTRLRDFQSAGEIESAQQNVKHCSMRTYARVRGAKGAVAGFFTFFDDKNESDIEILTDDTTDTIRYTNQPALDKKGNEVAAASKAISTLPKWDDWQTHRIDWFPKNSYWFLNDNQVAANTYSVPREPSYVVMNMWSDGGSWSGNMSVGDSAVFEIQWIELVFNTSGPVEGPKGGDREKREESQGDEKVSLWKRKKHAKGCETVCKVDDVKEIGHPEVVSVNKSGAVDVAVSWGLLAVVGFVSVLVGL